MDEIISERTPLISLCGLCKSFNSSGSQIDILKDANLDISKGETIAIMGASGIGKSTFLHVLGTLDTPDSGKLLFQGEDVFSFNAAALARFRNESIGFVFQFHHLLFEFNTLENVMIPILINGKSRREARGIAEKILLRVGLKERLFSSVGKLSGGEQQRVSLARALVLKPMVLLADEPTGNLDRKNSEQVHNLFIELNEEFDMTMIVVTHNPELASCMSRVITIVDGQLNETA
jgi:lipoprotein-releasing system ATP-binding protein